jgi:2-polyprenyl-3-methyl-5-hydroxy-6-metoxy-1,4-benzoquinol methylase
MQLSENKIYRNTGNEAVISEVLKYAAGKEGSSCLDVGCGGGDNARILHEHKFKIDGITYSEGEKALVKDLMDDVYVYNLEHGLPKEIVEGKKYDFVIMSHVLEHIAYPEKLFSDIKQVSKPDTKIVIALPNMMHYSTRFRILKGNFDYTDSGTMDYTHLRWYTLKSIQQFLKAQHFNIISTNTDVILPLNRVAKYLPKAIAGAARKSLAGISPVLFGRQLVVVANTDK